MNDKRKRSNEDQRVISSFVEHLNRSIQVFDFEFGGGPGDKHEAEIKNSGVSGTYIYDGMSDVRLEIEVRVARRDNK